MDREGNVFVVDSSNFTIRKLTPIGSNWVSSTIAGSPGVSGSADGTNANALFYGPICVAADRSGNLFVTDANQTVRKISRVSTNWVTTTIAGSAGNFGNADGTNNDARFHDPFGVAADQSGRVYVSEFQNGTIRMLTPIGTNWVSSTIAGLAGVNELIDGTNNSARFMNPTSLALDSTGDLYLSDLPPIWNDYAIRKIAPIGTNWVVRTIGGVLDGTEALAVGPEGDIYLVGNSPQVISRFVPLGTNLVLRTVAGQLSTAGSADGTNGLALFNSPEGIAFDDAGNLFICDTGNNTIRMGLRLAITPVPIIQSVVQSNGFLDVAWSAMPGLFYQAQHTEVLGSNSWISIGYPVLATNELMSVSDAPGAALRRFYRVMLLP